MGMFDYLNVTDALPFTDEMKELGLDKNNHSWQTKDLDNCLSTYTIQGGRLFEQKYKNYRHIDGNPKAEHFLDRIGHVEKEDPYLEQIYHHGEVYFYELISDVQDKWDCWVEFKAIFTHGVIERFELVKFEQRDNTQRKKQDEQWIKDIKKESSKWYNKYFRNTKPYRWVSFKWSKIAIAIADFFYKIAYKL